MPASKVAGAGRRSGQPTGGNLRTGQKEVLAIRSTAKSASGAILRGHLSIVVAGLLMVSPILIRLTGGMCRRACSRTAPENEVYH